MLMKCRDTHPYLLRELSDVYRFEILRIHAVKSRMNTGPLTVSREHSQKHLGSRPTEHAVNDFTYTARTQDRRFGRGAKAFQQVYSSSTELGIQSGRAYTRYF